MTPTQRSKKLLESRGYLVAIVEKWNPVLKRRHDLFGFADLLAVGADVLMVQTTSASNVSSRVNKIAESESVPIVRKAGIGIHVHGWRKVGNRWQCREVDLS
jgi:hypothetical protein